MIFSNNISGSIDNKYGKSNKAAFSNTSMTINGRFPTNNCNLAMLNPRHMGYIYIIIYIYIIYFNIVNGADSRAICNFWLPQETDGNEHIMAASMSHIIVLLLTFRCVFNRCAVPSWSERF